MHNTSFYQTNEAINWKFLVMRNEVLGSVNALMYVHTTMLENKNEPSLISTYISSTSNTNTINSTISDENTNTINCTISNENAEIM